MRTRMAPPTTSPFIARSAAAGSRPSSRSTGKASVLDLSKVEYISSAGFRVLLLLDRQAGKDERRLVLCGLTPKVRQLFDLGGFLDLFPIAQTQEEAIAAAK